MSENKFKLSAIGNTDPRNTLGSTTSVEIFRILRTALSNIIELQLGQENAKEAIYSSGLAVGGEIKKAFLSDVTELEDFAAKLKELLIGLKIGVMSIVSADVENSEFVIRVDECVSCSGTPNIGEAICDFEGGVVAGVLSDFLGKQLKAVETKCYGLGDSYCEFSVKPE